MKKRHINLSGIITENRRLLKIGNSWYLNVPPEFVERNNLKNGDMVPVICNRNLKALPDWEGD